MRMTSNENRESVSKETDHKSSIKRYKEPNVSDKRTTRERTKPLRILIVEPKGRYCKTVWCAIGIGITHLMLGATVMALLIFSINSNDAHVGICTIAYHFFSAEAILGLNYANGWSSPLRIRHRRFAHVFLQMCALGCAITGTALITIDKGISDSVHGITGILTTVLAGIAFLTGPCGLFGGRYLKILHMSAGIPTFLTSSICLCFGLYGSSFRSWSGDAVVFIMFVLVFFYTFFIIVTCFFKCIMSI